MQGILISLATAVILAIGGAFAAPFVVDWNNWRGTFETEIGRAIGVPVVIRGAIDAEILPAPRVVLRDVTLGDVVSTGGTVKELKAELSLGGLFRGEVQATGVTLVRPQMRIVLDSTGRVALPTGAGQGAEIAIARFEVQDGTLDVLDRASDHTFTIGDLDLRGEARSRSGPFRLDGEVEASGARYGLRSSLGKIAEDGTGRLKLQLDGRTRPYDLDLEGTLKFTETAPGFDGRAILTRKGGEGLAAWQLSAALKADPTAVVAENLELALGGAAIPAQLSGSARLALGRAIGLDAVLNARSLDLDAVRATAPDGAGANARPGAALTAFLTVFADLPAPDIASKIGLSAEQLVLGGTLVREARADITGSKGGWRIDAAEAQLPGKASLRFSGVAARTPAGPGFDGDAVFNAEDPMAFLRWAAPEAARDYGGAVKAPVRIAGKVSFQPARLAVEGLDATFSASRLRGSAQVAFDAAGGPRLNMRLSMDGFELDPIVAALQRAAAAVGGGADATLVLDGQNLTLAGLPLNTLALDASATGGNWRVKRMVMDDLAGVRLEGAGWMENFSSVPRGEFNLAISGSKADGLVALARLTAGEETAQTLARLLPIAAPVKLSTALVWSEAGGRRIVTDGTLGQLSGHVTFTRSTADVPLSVVLKVDAADGARALAALGLAGASPRAGPAQAELAIDPLAQGEARVRGRLALAGMELTADGTAGLSPAGVSPRLAVRLDGADLGRVLPQVAAAADNAPVPAALAFALSRDAATWRLAGMTGSLAGAPLSGEISLEPGGVPRLAGRLAFDTLSLPRVLGIFGARVAGGDAVTAGAPPIWSTARFLPNAVNDIALALDLSAQRITLLGPYSLSGGRLRLSSDGVDLDLRDLGGSFAGGRLAANLQLRRRADTVQADGRLVLDKVDAAALVAPAGARTPPQGQVSLTLDLSGNGRNLQGLMQTLAGQGTISVSGLRIDAADPAALEAVLAETASLPTPPDERRTAQLLDRALARGPLAIGAAESTIGVVNGVARLSPARTGAGAVRIGLGGTFDVPRFLMDATVDFEGQEVAGGVPAGTLAWRGSVMNPERRTGAAALTSIIAMRAIERETRRLEGRQGLARPDEQNAPAASRPAAQPLASGNPLPPPAAPAATTPRPEAPRPAPAGPAAPAAATVAPSAAPATTPRPETPRPAPATPAAPAAATVAPSAAPATTPRPETPRPAPAIPAAPAAATVAPPAAPATTPRPETPHPVPAAPAAATASPPAAPAGTPRPEAAPATQPAATVVSPQAASPARPAPAATSPAPARPQAAGERPDAPAGFGASTGSSPAGAATGARTTDGASEPAPASRPPRPERPAAPARSTAQSSPTRERPPAAEAPPRQSYPEPTLPPTRGFGDLPRPPGLVGE